MDFKVARQNMVDGQIKPSNVTDIQVLEAFLTTPREDFLPKHLQHISYIDEDLEIKQGRYLMEPVTLARLLQASSINENDVVLEIGAVSGYGTALLSKLAKTVVSLEDDADLFAFLQDYFGHSEEFCNTAVFRTALPKGLPEQGPYDIIFINGAVSSVPVNLFDQLSENGRLITVIKTDNLKTGRAVLYKKTGQTISKTELFDANIPFLRDFLPPSTFEWK